MANQPVYENPPYDVFDHFGRRTLEKSFEGKAPPLEWEHLSSLREQAQKNDFAVAIIGAGVGGLYTAMMLQSLDIRYDVFEATKHVGGRLYTQHMEKGGAGEYDYYDVGAMRFPDVPVSKRLFDLFSKLELTPSPGGGLLPYIFDSSNTSLLYNGVRHVHQAGEVITTDVFNFEEMRVPAADIAKGSKALFDDAIADLVHGLEEDIKYDPPHHKGWEALMKQDGHSTRSYLLQEKKYDPRTVNWMETVNTSTKSYDRALSEGVLDVLSFGKDIPDAKWYCVKGGSQEIAKKMQDKLKEPIQFNVFIAKVECTSSGVELSRKDGKTSHFYSHAISTVPLPTFRSLDIDQTALSNEQKYALRILSYGPAIKIGVKFKKAWWGDKGIKGGQSFSDRTIRTVVYPSYGLGQGETQSKVLIASYCWTEDAHRWAALIADGKEEWSEGRKRLKNEVLRDLAAVHNMDIKELENLYLDLHAWDWNADPLTQGAFAFFSPGDFSLIYPSLTAPNKYGNLHLAGEALSPRHAWVVGALDSAWRAVYSLISLKFPEKKKDFFRMWGDNMEWTAPTSEKLRNRNWHEDFVLSHWISQHTSGPASG